MSTGNAGAAIGLANTNKSGPIGAYVQDALWPTAENAYAGINTNVSYKTNALGEAIAFTAKGTSGATTGKTVQWVQSASTLDPTTNNRVNIVAGTATYNAAGTHDIFCNAVSGDYLWAVER